MITIICKQCGKVCKDYKSSKRTFCSRDCADNWKRKKSISSIHKIDCKCCVCKAKRGETKGMLNHKINCKCSFCKAMRSEYKGIKKTEEHKKKIGLGNKGNGLGIPRTEEIKEKIRKGMVGVNIWMIGTHHTEETKKKQRESCIRYYKSSEGIKYKKKMSLARGGTGISGELSEYGSEFDNNLKEQIRFRDNYKCQICGAPEVENNRRLDIHHIDYNKKNNNINNLISLCHSCHGKTNYNRKYWEEYFKEELLCH